MPWWPVNPDKPKPKEKKEYCRKFARAEGDRKYDHYQRDPEHKLRYHTGNWKTLSTKYRHAHPLCEECLKQGRYVMAELVHHRIPLNDGGSNDWDNLQALCDSCHNKIHRELKKRGKSNE